MDAHQLCVKVLIYEKKKKKKLFLISLTHPRIRNTHILPMTPCRITTPLRITISTPVFAFIAQRIRRATPARPSPVPGGQGPEPAA